MAMRIGYFKSPNINSKMPLEIVHLMPGTILQIYYIQE